MLRYLVAQAGRLVTKAELRQHVWGGSHVSNIEVLMALLVGALQGEGLVDGQEPVMLLGDGHGHVTPLRQASCD